MMGCIGFCSLALRTFMGTSMPSPGSLHVRLRGSACQQIISFVGVLLVVVVVKSTLSISDCDFFVSRPNRQRPFRAPPHPSLTWPFIPSLAQREKRNARRPLSNATLCRTTILASSQHVSSSQRSSNKVEREKEGVGKARARAKGSCCNLHPFGEHRHQRIS